MGVYLIANGGKDLKLELDAVRRKYCGCLTRLKQLLDVK